MITIILHKLNRPKVEVIKIILQDFITTLVLQSSVRGLLVYPSLPSLPYKMGCAGHLLKFLHKVYFVFNNVSILRNTTRIAGETAKQWNDMNIDNVVCKKYLGLLQVFGCVTNHHVPLAFFLGFIKPCIKQRLKCILLLNSMTYSGQSG